MSEDNRPVLTLKRKNSAPASAQESVSQPLISRRKKVVTVVEPPAWKVKKAQLEQAKHGEEARAAAEKASLRLALRRVKAVIPSPPPPPRYLKLIPPELAIRTLKAFWPQLFEGDRPHLLAMGIRDDLFADIERQALPLSHKQVIKCLKSLTRSECYLSQMQAGASRYDLNGNVMAIVTQEEERYAKERIVKERLRAERMQRHLKTVSSF
ncbi:fertility inhibition protein FinO [uncultured Cedecea sp.]|uniref:fertility inhibition protein FinO n=1 Tax=uncultured Cedecea sp. TaxID=988762 RepID=UPI002633EA02|nr:fertility inhibition protein FinO [uncultured Cedecea sp.]